MTGYGEGRQQQDAMGVAVEVRSVNSRYLKVSVRSNETITGLEPQIESAIREHGVRRGHVTATIRMQREPGPEDYQLHTGVLTGYLRQLQTLCDKLHVSESIHVESLLMLPGVVRDRAEEGVDADRDWPVVKQALSRALDGLCEMRAAEGRAMKADLAANLDAIAGELDNVRRRAPDVLDGYRARITERMRQLLDQHEVELDTADLVREVGIFAERSDISEEVVRLETHLTQFRKLMEADDASGRQLDFLTQEMFRETNTIGSKGNDAQIAGFVVEMKTAIERIREMVQNIE